MGKNKLNLESQNYKVLLTTSGIGSRLGQITDYTNKSLAPLGGKLAIQFIIECYPMVTTFVVTLGHYGEHVREFLEIAYPEKNFEFVDIKKFKGPGSSLAHSMLQAKPNLQAPFIYHACDTILIGEEIPEPEFNWCGGVKNADTTNYTSFDVAGNIIKRYHEKGMINSDYAHIGLIGINNYLEFWAALESTIKKDTSNVSLNDVSAIKLLISQGINFNYREFPSWIDIGSTKNLNLAKIKFNNEVSTLEKNNESVAFVGNSVVKFFADENIVKERVIRSNFLENLIPKIEQKSKYFYRYEYINAEIASSINDNDTFSKILHWANSHLWVKNEKHYPDQFYNTCKNFYIEKTLQRLSNFYVSRDITDKSEVINGVSIPKTLDLIKAAEKILLEDLRETGFHGDFILDNILITADSFKLIDWRQNFGGNYQYGDMYYDLSKLKHSLFINHTIINQNLYFIRQEKNEIKCGVLRRDISVLMEKELNEFITLQKMSLKKLNTLTSIIWLNMAALHHHPFDEFLYYYGKLHLWRSLNEF